MNRKDYAGERQCETCRFGGHKEKGCMAQPCTPRYAPKEGCPLYAMSAQAFMQRVTNAQRRIVNMEEMAARYRDMATGTTANVHSVCIRGTQGTGRVGTNMDAYLDICADIEREAQRLREYLKAAMEVIGYLADSQEREVLELRYLSGMGWIELSMRMGLNERTARRIHVKALEHVQREMDLLEYTRHRPGWNPGGAQVQPQAVQ